MSEILRIDRVTATVDPCDGGRLTSLVLDGKELLAFGVPEEGMPPGWYHGSFPMAPYAGRVKDAQFDFNGDLFRLPANAGPHAGHGLVFDVPWIVTRSDHLRELELSVDLDGRWPFGGSVLQRFELDESGLTVTLRLANERTSMPGSLGFHPWFRTDLGDGPAVIEFEPASRLVPDDDGFPRVPSSSLGVRPWDDVFAGVIGAPTINWPKGPRLEIRSTAGYWIVYEKQPNGFCLEPISSPPDSLAHGPVVAPGQPGVLEMRIYWGTGG